VPEIRTREIESTVCNGCIVGGLPAFLSQHVSIEVYDGPCAIVDEQGATTRPWSPERDGSLVGFVIYVFHPTTLFAAEQSVYLEDLFVDPANTRRGVGRALIHAVLYGRDRVERPRRSTGMTQDIQRRRTRLVRHLWPPYVFRYATSG